MGFWDFAERNPWLAAVFVAAVLSIANDHMNRLWCAIGLWAPGRAPGIVAPAG